MTDRRGGLGGLLSKGSERSTTGLESALEERLEPAETTRHRLPGTRLVRETDDGQERLGEESLAVVTDRRVSFAVADRTAIDIPHTDIRTVTLESGLLRKTVLEFVVWGGGRYQFRPAAGDAERFAAHVAEASDCWQYVETLLEEFETHATVVESALSAGEDERGTRRAAEAEETLTDLRERVSDAGLESVLGSRLEAAREKLGRARVRGRLERAETLIETTEPEPGAAYEKSYERYERAREQLDAARAVATDHGVAREAVEATQKQLQTAMESLASRPVQRAERAVERAVEAETLAAKADALEDALEQYHGALTLGWGRQGPDRDREQLRFCVELAACELVETHRERATRRNLRGDECAMEGKTERAREHYREAQNQLAAALDIASEFRSPDPEPLASEHARLARKASDVALPSWPLVDDE